MAENLSSSSTPQWERDVFVSFSFTDDEETKSFITELFDRLNEVGISYFRVGKQEGVREENKAERFKAISLRRCAIAVIVFSKNFLNEPFLSELVEILTSKTDDGLVVIPIFSMPKANVSKLLTGSKYENWWIKLEEAQNISGYYELGAMLKAADNGYKSKPIDIIAERLVREIHSLYSEKVFGPFGGKGVKIWKSTSQIYGITVRYGKFIEFIEFIDFEAENDSREPLTNNGENGEQNIYKVKLREGEYISSFAGYFEDAGEKKIKSLTFRTNERTLGPIRVEKEDEEEAKKEKENEKYFSIPSKAGKVTEIFWRINNNGFLKSIKANVELHSEEFKPILAESFGKDSNQYKNVGKIIFELDSGGKPFIEIQNVEKDGELEKYDSNKAQLVKSYELKSDGRLTSMSKSIGPFGGGEVWDDGKFNGVREIHLVANDGIRYIKIVYDKDCKNDPPSHGSEDSRRTKNKIILDYPREYLTSISGYKQDDGSISKLIFYSNKTKYCCGQQKGKYFCSPTAGSRIIGFYGTWGKTLNSIGVHVEPIPHMRPFEIMRPPFRGSGGTYWDDGVHSNVIAFRVTEVMDHYDPKTKKYVGDNKIRSLKIESITFKYDNNGVEFIGRRRGGGKVDTGEWVNLNFPEERLTAIKGIMSEEDGQTIIHTLSIYTSANHNSVSAYANRGQTQFNLFIPNINDRSRRIVGFFGTAGKEHLNSIGARLEPY